jgi:hypothetical protein
MCEEIKWALPICKQPTRPMTLYEMLQQLGSYNIIEINNILRAIQVAPPIFKENPFLCK